REGDVWAAREIANGGIELLLRGLKLARQLRVEVAAAVDVANQRLTGRGGPFGGRLGGAGLASDGGQAPPPVLEGRTRRLEVAERFLIRGEALAVQLSEHADGPRRLAEATRVRGREDQTHVAGLSKLVHRDEP